MTGTVHIGTMMIQEGLLLPESLGLESDGYSENWRSVRNLDAFSLDRKVRAFGWNLFCMAGQVKAIALGRGGEKGVRRGIQRITAKVRSLNFNCLGLTEIVQRQFLGIPYLSISAQSYHIQENCLLQSKDERRRLQGHADWARR